MGGLELPEFEIELSVVISCYFEEESIDEFYQRLASALRATGRSYEILFVNDGSTDDTFARLEAIFESDPNVSAVIDLMKNVGQANAKTPAVMLARGRSIVMIDSDLQLDPEQLGSLLVPRDEGADVVSGYRHNRRDPWNRKLPSLLANVIMRRASASSLRDFGCTYKIYDGRLVRAFEFDAFKPWRAVPVIARAQRIVEVPVTHHPRRYGQSGWTFRKLFAYNMENLVNLSDRPFQWLGGVFLLLAGVLVLRLFADVFWDISILPRVTSGLVLNVLTLGLLAVLGLVAVVGEFVIRNFIELQGRPAFIVRSLRRRDPVDAVGGRSGADAPAAEPAP